MLLLYRIYAFLSSIYGIVHFPEYDGLHKYQTFHTFQTSRTFQTFQTTQPPVFPPSSLYSRARKLTMRQRKVDSYRLYCVAGKLTAAVYIYNVYPAVQSRISSAQKQANAQPNKNTTSHTMGSSLGAIRSTQPPANALTSAPNAHRIFTITGYLQPVQTPL